MNFDAHCPKILQNPWHRDGSDATDVNAPTSCLFPEIQIHLIGAKPDFQHLDDSISEYTLANMMHNYILCQVRD
jgi:hypothetical protein